MVRTNHIVGARQSAEEAVPRFILQRLGGRPISLQGEGWVRRSFLAVQDAARALDVVMRRGAVGETYNIGTERQTTAWELAKTIITLVRARAAAKGIEEVPGAEVVVTEDRTCQDIDYYINSSKLNRLGWKPVVSLESVLTECVAHYAEVWAATDEKSHETVLRSLAKA